MGNKFSYTKIIVLGSGKLAFECAVKSREYIENTIVLEYKVTESTTLKKMCEKEGIAYLCCDKDQLFQCLHREGEKTLVVSAGNTYIVPDAIIGKNNLMIVNWHNALLPRHKGRNAESWSIYEGDRVTGITWHRLVRNVDAGDILAQESIEIDDKITALQLFQRQCELGVQVFDRILESLLLDACDMRRQEESKDARMHFSCEIPNDGWLNPEWGYEQINCFLRAMDYGGLRLLGDMHVRWQGEEYSFYKYKITDEDVMTGDIIQQNDDLILYKAGHKITLKSLKRKGK